ncbi:MAG: OmpH family outer membrane protein [Proteobacteria bacterium]|nr:OmpH family outer membrane protein [Pseudomonadota bacterium]
MAVSWLRHVLVRGAVTLFAAFLWMAIHSGLGAQEPNSPVFAIIDVQGVLRESTAVKSLSRDIEERRSQYQGELRKKEEALRKADRELSRQRSILSPEAYAQKRGELERKVATLQRAARKRKRGLEQIFASGMSKVQNELTKIAKEIAEERGLDLILSKATVVIVKPKFEITQEAVKRLNTRLPEVPLAQELN